MNKTIDESIEHFVEYLRVEKGLAPLTIEAYRCDLAQLLKFLGDRSVIAARRKDLQDCVGKLLAAMSPRSAARKMATWRHFFKFLSMDGLIVANPRSVIDSPKGWKKLPAWLTSSEINAVLTAPQSDDAGSLRDRAMLELPYGAALRASEIVSVRLSDLDLVNRCVLVHGKRDKERMAPFGHRAGQALKRYLEHCRPGSRWLFPGDKEGQHLTRMRLCRSFTNTFSISGAL